MNGVDNQQVFVLRLEGDLELVFGYESEGDTSTK